MKEAILRFPAPESCKECRLSFINKKHFICYGYEPGEFEDVTISGMENYEVNRHRDCPLKIQEVIESKTIDWVKTHLIIPEGGYAGLTEKQLDKEIAILLKQLQCVLNSKEVLNTINDKIDNEEINEEEN